MPPDLASRLAEHLALVSLAMAIGLSLAIPLGVLAARRPLLARVALGAANGLQTIPSLALFGVLLTVPFLGGIGPAPAVVALSVYALLPLLRTTVIGLQGVPAGLLQAGLALGLNRRQVLWTIEFPLAWPVILTGIRLATVSSVGLATVAAAIGAGGLGVFIFRGIATVDHGLILAGALPAAALALLLDGLLGLDLGLGLGRLRDWLSSHRRRRWSAPRVVLPLLLVVVSLVALPLTALLLGAHQSKTVITIGSKNFTEQVILGELLAQQIEHHTSLTVKRQFDLGGTFVLHDALRRGQVDGYVEYTGTAWTAILKRPPISDAQRVWKETAKRYQSQFDLTVFPSLGFDNTFAILVRKGDAQRHHLHTISDLVPLTPTWRAGFGFEFLNRRDGYQGLSHRYGLVFRTPPREMDLGLTYRALADGQVDVIAGNATDGQIAALNFTHLVDDRHYFPPYQAVPVFNSASLRRHPELVGVIKALVGTLDASTMGELNRQVDLEHRQPAEVVGNYLNRSGFRKAVDQPASSSSRSPASSSTATPSSWALVSLLPASSPATT
jgi:osmoprotectant transport system permease protein